MTLQAIIDLVLNSEREGMLIYRVKEHDRYNELQQLIYSRKRYVVFQRSGYSLCSCGQGCHLGIPCRHIFAVVFNFRQHGFNISQVDKQWMIIGRREAATVRPWLYLPRMERSSQTEIATVLTPTSVADPSLPLHRCFPQRPLQPGGLSHYRLRPKQLALIHSSLAPDSKPALVSRDRHTVSQRRNSISTLPKSETARRS